MILVKYLCVFVLLYFSCAASVTASTLSSDAEAEAHNAKVAENRLTTQVLAIVEHFKQEDPVGIPGAPVPEPMVIESIKQSFSMQEVLMKNVSIYGLSKFRIKYSKVDLNSMLATAIVHLDKMHMEGTYFIKNFFTSRTGPFTVDMEDIYTTANLTLGVSLEGKLEVQTIQMDIVSDKKIAVDFQNLGVLAVLQSVLNSASNAIFGAVKPFMLSEAYSKITVKVNEALDNASKDFILPNSISPLDMGIAEARKKVRQMGYDPFHVPPYNQTKGVLNIQVKDTVVTGISSFYRVGNITVTMINNTIIAGFQIGTQKIHGFTRWEGGVGILTRGGQASFTLQHLKVKVTVEQPLDVRNKPKIKTLQMELGNIQVRCDGAGTADYVVEFVVNILPNLLRYQMMAALENPVKSRVQEEMNKYDVEKVLREYLPKFEQLGLKMDFDFKIEL